MKHKRFVLIIFLMLTNVQAKGLRLSVPEPQLFLPSISAPLEQREAKITPLEYPLAQELKPLLDNNQYSDVLTKLEKHQIQQETISPALHLLTAQIHMQLKQTESAEKNYLAALKQMPDLVRAHRGLSILYLSIGEMEQSQTSLIRAISLGLGDSNSYAQLGYLNMQLNDSLSSVSAYQQALMLAPVNKDIQQGLLFALIRSKQISAAGSLLDKMLKESPNKSAMWLQRANLALESEDKDKALASMEVAIRLGDKTPATRLLAAQIHLSKQNYNRAVFLLGALIESKQLDMSAFDGLLSWMLREKKWEHASRLLAKMKTRSQRYTSYDKSRLFHFEGVLAGSNGRTSQAKASFQRAINTDPSNGDALIALAKLVTNQSDFTHAELLYQRAERLKTVRLQAMLGRAQIYINQQGFGQALDLLRKAKHEFPTQHGLEANIQSLASIVNNQS
ncbi:MAG: tetratricopeptide repeat protein [Kangiellaceae bacterium]|nr:tetratricopeptide repeat protein [Kangiellaceae bacterium]